LASNMTPSCLSPLSAWILSLGLFVFILWLVGALCKFWINPHQIWDFPIFFYSVFLFSW
jgi:hypothetical protein